MNERFDLTEILKGCPEGTKFYSTIFGDVEFVCITDIGGYSIVLKARDDYKVCVDSEGKYLGIYNGECILFPSRDQRDWSKFKAPWRKKGRFDPNTFHPYNEVLVRDDDSELWRCAFYSHQVGSEEITYRYATSDSAYVYCIPYNDDTKHLVGTKDEAPEYYRYWED